MPHIFDKLLIIIAKGLSYHSANSSYFFRLIISISENLLSNEDCLKSQILKFMIKFKPMIGYDRKL